MPIRIVLLIDRKVELIGVLLKRRVSSSWRSMLKIDAISFLDWEAVSLEVAAGEAVAVWGASGSGKSLLLRAVADLIPHEGNCFLHSKPCASFAPSQWRRRVSYLSPEALWWEDSVRAHFSNEPDFAQLGALGFDASVLDWEPARLSTGERQRLGVLRMLAREPEALLLDEPTSNLDEATVASVESLLLGYIRNNEAAAIWVTHDRAQASRVGWRGYEMSDKKLVENVYEC